jgi:hypothetical protein
VQVSCEHGNELHEFKKRLEFLVYLSDCWLLLIQVPSAVT